MRQNTFYKPSAHKPGSKNRTAHPVHEKTRSRIGWEKKWKKWKQIRDVVVLGSDEHEEGEDNGEMLARHVKG